MSVAPLTAQELGCFVAIAHKHLGAGPIPQLCELAAIASHGNAGAFSAQYGEPMEPNDVEEIEAIALDYLAERRDMVADHFGPIAYNMVDNDGRGYIAPGVQATEVAQLELIKGLSDLEHKAQKWQDGERHKMRRAERDAEAFDDVGQLPVLSKAEIEEKMRVAGADRIIIAEFNIDESDSQTDYFGGRTSRTVVIGFGKGKRENFRQLRAAAGKFPPTAHMGMGKDIYCPCVVLLDDVISNGGAYWHGSHSHWHHELDKDASFSTEIEALAHIQAKGEPCSISFDGKTARFGWEVQHSSYEHRECYSMGGGNYLGSSRYGGWKVRSRLGGLWADRCEFWGK